MSFKDLISSLFTYTPDNKETYNFNLVEDLNTKIYPDSTLGNEGNEKTKIFPSVTVNTDYLKSKYNLLINSDIISRDFVLVIFPILKFSITKFSLLTNLLTREVLVLIFLKLLPIILPFEKSKNSIYQTIFLVVSFLKMQLNKSLLLKMLSRVSILETVPYL